MLCPLNIKKMAASSRCIASLLKTVHFSPRLCPRLLSRQANYPQYRNIIPRYFSIRPTRFPNYGSNGNWLLRRYCTQQPGQTNQTPADGGPPKPATSILGSVRGIGIADQVLLKKQTDLNDSGQRREQDQTEKKSSSQEERDEEARKKKEADEASWKTIKYSMIFMGVSMSGLAGFLIATWGAPEKDNEGNDVDDRFSGKWLPLQYLLRAWNAAITYSQMIQDPSWDKLLPDPVKEPYYQPPYTLVLEMTGVLVHPDWTYQTGWRFKKRPGIDFFLAQVGPPTFEVVTYTAEQAFTAYPILNALDPNGYIMFKLFRDATRYVDGHHVKDLDCLNRDLSKVIVIDWNTHSTQSHPRNALKIKEWKGNDDDRTLIDLALLLKTIATSEVKDVREVLDFYNQFDDPIEAFRENQRRLQEQQELTERLNKEKLANPTTTSLVRGLFGRRF